MISMSPLHSSKGRLVTVRQYSMHIQVMIADSVNQSHHHLVGFLTKLESKTIKTDLVTRLYYPKLSKNQSKN